MTIVRNTAPAGFENAHFPVHPEDEASIIALYNGGLGDNDIARKMYFTPEVLVGILARLTQEGRIKPRAMRGKKQVGLYLGPLTAEQKRLLISCYTANMPQLQMRIVLDRSRSWVAGQLRRLIRDGELERRQKLPSHPPRQQTPPAHAAATGKHKADWKVMG